MCSRHTTSGITVLIYVDDIIITRTDIQACLHFTFHMKDLGPLQYFLGLEILKSPYGIFINQHKYIKILLP